MLNVSQLIFWMEPRLIGVCSARGLLQREDIRLWAIVPEPLNMKRQNPSLAGALSFHIEGLASKASHRDKRHHDHPIAVHDDRRKQDAVHPVQHAAVPRKQGAKIFDAAVALNHAGKQIAHLRRYAAD